MGDDVRLSQRTKKTTRITPTTNGPATSSEAHG